MNFNSKIINYAIVFLTIGLVICGCQKLERPELKELILDPPPPPYSPLKDFWAFENNTRDTGQYRLIGKEKNITYAAGVNGQAAVIGAGGYLVVPAVNDSLKTPGSLTVAFWMNGAGPVKDGAQGLFSISNKNEFFGNFELFLENNDNGSEGFFKLHMLNTNATDGKGEEWSEVKIPDALNKWTHIAITYNAVNSQLTIYADGQPAAVNNKVLGAGKYGALKFKDVNGLVIGTYQFQTDPTLSNHGPEEWAKSFNGAIDQFRLYNVALTAAEVSDLFTTKK